MGHISRCLALAEGFLLKGNKVKFILRGVNIPKQTSKPNIAFVFKEWFDKSFLDELIKDHYIVIVDSYRATNDILKFIGERFYLPVFLVDSTLNYYPKGVVFFPSVYSNRYKSIGSSDFILISGKKYLLFNKDLWGRKKVKLSEEINKVGISLGQNIQEKLITKLIQLINSVYLNVEIIVFGEGESSLKHVHFLGFLSSGRYYNEVLSCDLMIVNGGQSLNECLLIGVPSISLILAENQKENSIAWQELELTKSVDYECSSFDSSFSTALQFYSIKHNRKTFSKRSRDLLNARGAILAADELLNTLTSFYQ